MVKRKKVPKAAAKTKVSRKSVARTKQVIDKFNKSGAATRCKEWIQIQKDLRDDKEAADNVDAFGGLNNSPVPGTSPSQFEVSYTADEVLEDKNDSPAAAATTKTQDPAENNGLEEGGGKLKRVIWAKYKKNVIFPCEWKHCNEEFRNKDEFSAHVTAHASEIKPNEDLYECLWDLCGFITTQFSALTRHLNFHAYHTILKVRNHILFS